MKQLVALIVVMFSLSVAAMGQDTFPEGHWLPKELGRLHKQGRVLGFPVVLGPRTRFGRYEYAVTIHATYAALRGRMDRVRSNAGANEFDLASLATSEYTLKVLEEGTKELSRELSSMGVNVQEMEQDLAALTTRVAKLRKEIGLPDVPDDHWAAQAVLTLKANGLLSGYPGGKFRG